MGKDDATLLDIARAARLAVEFGKDMDKAAFGADLKTQSAILHQLLVLGESVKRLSEEFKEAHTDIPWRLIAGMRDNIIHEYDAVDLDEVWRVLVTDLPQLIQKLNPLLSLEEA